MFVCICHAVTDVQVEHAVDSGAETLEAVGLATRAGSSCGSCHDQIEDIIEVRCGSCPLARLVA